MDDGEYGVNVVEIDIEEAILFLDRRQLDLYVIDRGGR